MSAKDEDDIRRAKESEMAADHNARGPRDEQHGAIHGRHSPEQMNAWEIAKIDLSSEQKIEHEMVAEKGEPPASLADEARHGADVVPTPPAEFTGERIVIGKRAPYAAGIPADVQSMKYAYQNMGAVKGARMLLQLNQTDGFDCPGCAWPDPPAGERAHTEFCENGAKAASEENTRKRIEREFFREHSVAELSQRSDYWLAQQGRVTEPMVLRSGATHYEPISWDDAFTLIASRLNALDDPNEASFYTSGRTANETAFLYQLFVRQFGTNNLPDCSNMCHESSGTALTDSIGIGKGTATLDDVHDAGVFIDLGHNPGTCHPRMLTALQLTKRNGGKIIAINPLPETGLMRFQHPQQVLQVLTGRSTQLADLFLPVRINGDVAILQGIMKEMLAAEDAAPGTVFDHEFIRQHTVGFEPYIAKLRLADWDIIVEESGIAREQIAEAARIVMSSDRLVVAWAMGLTQHKNAVSSIQECMNLLLLKGAIGRKGAGALPVRGHSNVQGDRTMGVWERVAPPFLDALGKEFDFTPPHKHGYDAVETLRALHAGKVKVFFAMGGNFLSATPDTEYGAAGLRRCTLTAHVAIKLNRSHLVTGEEALILPTIGRSERDIQNGTPQFVSVENSMGIVSKSEGRLDPPEGDLLSEPVIVGRLARATLGARSTVDWEGLVADYDRIRDCISRVIPGFDDFNAKVRVPGGFYLPNLPRDKREWSTHSGKATFTCHDIPRTTLEPGQLVMMSVRSHDQFNTTVYGLDDRYRGVHGERRVIFMNPSDVDERGLAAGQVVDLTSHFEGETRVARQFIVVPFDIPRKCAATYFPETNVLVPVNSVAARSNTPTSKYVVITVAPSASSRRFDYDRVEGAQLGA
ncbi:MAG: oxidoreductase alpha (molybdopterin) subunit [Gemmatimonadetes bacterium]|nr:oxidoreductase alpha (molybdopterin) subunit [Gemmatimonadota bacterium]